MIQADLTLEEEKLASGSNTVVGMDEVGRGAIAGPVVVGACALQRPLAAVPLGLTDSKLLSATKRNHYESVLKLWVKAWALGWASALEIDQLGIMGALNIAGRRALAQLCQDIGKIDAVLLDGNVNWLNRETDLFSSGDQPALEAGISVQTIVKGDQKCASIAAASILAKVARDAYMGELGGQDPRYDWAANKGYGSKKHRDAVVQFGLSEYHRRSWKLI